MGVSKNRGTPKSSILIGVFHYFHHPFWDTPIFGNTQMKLKKHPLKIITYTFSPKVSHCAVTAHHRIPSVFCGLLMFLNSSPSLQPNPRCFQCALQEFSPRTARYSGRARRKWENDSEKLYLHQVSEIH